jgi:toxin FitB
VIRYLLDTNIVSEVHKPRPHGGVVAWVNSLEEEEFCLSAVTLCELQEGIERRRERDAAMASALEMWVNELEISATIIAMDSRCFRETARLMLRKPEDLLFDAMIAATARVHNLTVSTRNEKDFRQFGVDIYNPFTFRKP